MVLLWVWCFIILLKSSRINAGLSTESWSWSRDWQLILKYVAAQSHYWSPRRPVQVPSPHGVEPRPAAPPARHGRHGRPIRFFTLALYTLPPTRFLHAIRAERISQDHRHQTCVQQVYHSSFGSIATLSIHSVDWPWTLQLLRLHEQMFLLRLNTVWVTKCRASESRRVLEQMPHFNSLFTWHLLKTKGSVGGLTAGFVNCSTTADMNASSVWVRLLHS